MLEWLQGSQDSGTDATVAVLAARLGAAFVLGIVVAGVYIVTQRKQRTEVASLATTLILLTILIAMVTLVIGNSVHSVARAFTLVGALAIVRFRTVVEDTRDTAFVIFAVIVGMAVGAGYVLVALLGIPVVAVAALLANACRAGAIAGASASAGAAATAARDFTLAIRIGIGRDPAAVVKDVLDKHLVHARLIATGTARQGAAIEITYRVRFREGEEPTAFVAAMNQVEGMQSVELRAL